MRRALSVGLLMLSALVGSSLVGAQFLVAPGPENTLSVTVTGSAEAPAEWAELPLTIEGKGATAQEALGACDAAAQRALDELATLQIAPENLRLGPPELSSDPVSQMMSQIPGDEDEPALPHAVHRTLTVRMSPVDPEAVYEWFCQVIDIAADAGATLKTGSMVSAVLSGGSDAIRFGVSDPKPLRAQAIRNGLAAAKEAAEVTAAASGRKLGEVAVLQVASFDAEDGGYMALIGGMLSAPKPGLAGESVLLTVTYRLQ